VSYPTHGDPDVVVREVLAQQAYRHAGVTTAGAPARSPLDLAWTWIVDHLISPLVGTIGRALGSGRGVGTAIGVAALVLAATALAYIVYRIALGAARTQRPQATTSEVPLHAARDAAAWRAFAREAAARGEYATAIAALFAAALVTLDERAIVTFDPARTPGEYRSLVRRERAVAADAFDELAAAFVRARFGPGRSDAAAFGAATSAYERFAPLASAT